MKIRIDYDGLFFGKFNMPEEEKRKTALYLAEKAFSEKMAESGGSAVSEDGMLEISGAGYFPEIEEERAFDSIRFLLAREFFIFAEKEEQKADAEEVPFGAAEKYIRQNYMYPSLSAAETAQRVGIPRSALDKLFKEKYDATVTEYIKSVRVEKAKAMIQEGVSLKDCAEECGFGSEKTMKRAFVALIGMSPHAYRTMLLDSRKNL